MPGRRPAAAILVALLCLAAGLAAACAGGGRGSFARQYEYEEDVYLDLDGSATVIVNSSIPALVALRGMPLPTRAAARVDREEVRRLFESPVAEVTRVSRSWRRQGRRFIQVRLEVPDIRQLQKASPFSWARYELSVAETGAVFRQRVEGKGRPVPEVKWTGAELVAFKLHLPSRIFYHNVRDLETNSPGSAERGNILRWEQRLADRLAGVPVEMEARMDRESILHRTLWLFAGAFAGAMVLLVGLIWWTIRRGRPRQPRTPNAEGRMAKARSKPGGMTNARPEGRLNAEP
ncbi:MAG TPA: hypothetical protein VK886_21135 [Vicinamibacterales bacterium]|nr:hypothetical protein [Vicinamibacterales bacterium]